MKVGDYQLFDYQQDFMKWLDVADYPLRTCLYYKTGAGKSLTALAAVQHLGHTRATVITPPATHDRWQELGDHLGIKVSTMSHAKFRMKDTRLGRSTPIIADEMHMFGGQKGQGWRKLDTLARHLKAPLILASATPNYNDAERVYCIQHVLDPDSCRGGFLQFLYENCETEQDPFSMTPKVLGFKQHASAADYLADLPGVHYLPDDLVYTIEDLPYDEGISDDLLIWGVDQRRKRVVSSLMERRHVIRHQGLVDPRGYIRSTVMWEVHAILGAAESPVMVFANHATIARALGRTLSDQGSQHHQIVTGETTFKRKAEILDMARQGLVPVLIGTTTLATGTDGLDKVFDTLVILDDTDDDALRRQLIGRIMPRGASSDASSKRVVRFVPQAL